MKADLTRGHQPDRKRGKSYRRVLLEQGRLLLDSDWAALVDAIDGQLRSLSEDLGCAAGSSDSGFLVTPGPLVATFDGAPRWSASPATFVASRDYLNKYLDRFPSLHLSGALGAGAVDIPGRWPLAKADFPTLRIWARTSSTVHVDVEGVAVPNLVGTDADNFLPYDLLLPAAVPAQYRALRLRLDAGAANVARIGLIEGLEQAGTMPHFWVTGGDYYLGGLVGERTTDARYPEVNMPPGGGGEPPDAVAGGATRFLAYLEMFERHITAAHDPGIREQALGGSLDTTTRTTVVPQVKVVVAGAATPNEIRSAFRSVGMGGGRLTVDVTSTIQKTSPCAVPEVSGYSGDTNRLYWMEVHGGGPLGAALLKWSRTNGSDLIPVTEVSATGQVLTLAPGAELDEGSIAEFVGEATEVGDESPASLTAGGFTPSQPRVGPLFVVEQVPGSSPVSGLQVSLLDRVTHAPASLTPAQLAAAGDPATFKVRRWHGLLQTGPADPATSTFATTIEDGIAAELSEGPFRVGDWWQFEVRRDQENANGPWRAAPHGPERLFAPLALLDHNGNASPLEIVEWFDDQFSSLCDLTADDIAYDGASAGTDADTVQEAIDELFQREEGCCCDATIGPSRTDADDALRIRELITDRLPRGGSICLRSGTYRFASPLVVEDIPIALHGCPDAVIVVDLGDAPGAMLVRTGGRLELHDLIVVAPQGQPGLRSLVDVAGSAASFTAVECGLVHGDGGAGANAVVVRVGGAELDPKDLVDVLEPPPTPSAAASFYRFATTRNVVESLTVDDDAPSVSLRDSAVLGAFALVANRLLTLDVHGSVVAGSLGGVAVKAVGHVDVSDSAFDTSITEDDLAKLSQAPPEDLEGAFDQLLEARLGQLGGPGVAAFFEQVLAGSMRDSAFAGAAGIWVAAARELALEQNVVHASHTAVRMDNALRSRVTGGRLAGGAIAVHLPLLAVDSVVESAQLIGWRGIVAGADAIDAPLSPPQRIVQSLQLRDNHALAQTVGIQVGRGDGAIEIGKTRAVTVLDNSVQQFLPEAGVKVADTSGIIGVVLGSGKGPDDPWLDIAGNGVSGFKLGIFSSGDGVSITRNRVRAPVSDEISIGIRLDQPGRAVVEANEIELTLPVRPGTAGISIEGGSAVRVANNVVDAAARHASVVATGTTRMTMTTNTMGSGDCTLVGVVDLILRDNDIGGMVVVSGDGGVVSGNVLGGGASSLTVSPARGRWQVEGNRVVGTLAVRPGVQLGWFGGLLRVAALPKTAAATTTPETVRHRYAIGDAAAPLFAHDLATAGLAAAGASLTAPQAQGFLALDYVPLAGKLAGSAEGAEERTGLGLSTHAINAALDPGGGAGSAVGSVTAEASAGLERALVAEMARFAAAVEDAGVEDDPAAGPTIVILNSFELAYQAQVEANWARNLHVGYASPGTLLTPGVSTSFPNAASVLQVVANRVEEVLVVNDYTPHLVMALNVADSYNAPASVISSRIVNPNHIT